MGFVRSGNLINFYSPGVANVESLKVHFSPMQSGEGDPSPSNVREIQGWNEVEVYYRGKNFIDQNILKDYHNYPIDGAYGYEYTNDIPIPLNVNMIGKFTGSDKNIKYCNLYITNGAKYPVNEGKYRTVTFTTNSSGKTRFGIYRLSSNYNSYQSALTDIFNDGDFQLELGSTATNYEPYQGITYPISWENDIGTIYGGYMNLITGELVQEWINLPLTSSLNWHIADRNSSGVYFYYENSKAGEQCLWSAGQYSLIDAQEKYTHGKVENPWSEVGNNAWAYWATNNTTIRLSFADDMNITSVDDLKDWLDEQENVSICYPLATPIIHQLTPTTLSLLRGVNNIWSNANGVIELEHEVVETKQIAAIKKRIIHNEPHLKTTTGSIASFSTDMKAPIKECKVSFLPVQEGSGDPSLSNVRAITGWTGVSVYKTGKNLINENNRLDGAQFKTVNGVYQIGSANVYSICSIPVPKNIDLHISKSIKIGSELAFGDVVGIMGTPVVVGGSMTNYFNRNFNSGECMYAYLMFGKTTTLSDPTTQWQLEFGDEKTAYEAPKGMTELSVTFPSSAGTVYGGYVDLVKGELVAEWKYFNLQSNKISARSGTDNFKYDDAFEDRKLTDSSYDFMCTAFPVQYISETGTPYVRWSSSTSTSLSFIKNDSSLALEDLQTLATNNQLSICYQLATPITYTLTPQQLSTLRSINNIWSNANGNIEVTYYSH